MVKEGEWVSRGSRRCAAGGEGESRAQRERGQGRRSPKTTSTDGYGSDDKDPDPDDRGAASDGSSNSLGRGRGSVRSEKEWAGWMGDLRCRLRIAAEHIRMSIVTVYHCLMNIYMFYSPIA
jgi:hypothetical protein